MKILHVLANGPPDVNGYAVRTHGLMKVYSELPNIEVVGLTSPWYPDRESMTEPIGNGWCNLSKVLTSSSNEISQRNSNEMVCIERER